MSITGFRRRKRRQAVIDAAVEGKAKETEAEVTERKAPKKKVKIIKE